MRRRSRPNILLWVLLAILAGAGFVLVINDESGVTFGLPNQEFGELAALVAMLVFLGSALVVRLPRPGDIIRAITIWSLILAVLVGAYAYRTELMGVGGRILGVLAPGVPVAGRLTGEGGDTVVINRAHQGHFAVRSSIDDLSLTMLVDTGASFITLTSGDANRLGFDVDELRFSIPIHTANGVIHAAPIRIERLRVGSIERRDLKALVAPPDTLAQSLLGLSFLNTLQGYTVTGDRLILTP